MSGNRGASSIRTMLQDAAAEDRAFVPSAMRPVRARGLLAVLVLACTAALVLTLGLPSYALP